jgi:subtilisin family serine protease
MAKLPHSGHTGAADNHSEQPDGQGTRGTRADSTHAPDPPGRRVVERRKQFLVTPQSASGGLSPFALGGAPPPSLQSVEQALRTHPEVDVVRTIGTRGVDPMSAGPGGFGIGPMSTSPGGYGSGALVARMTDDKARALQQQAGGQLVIERDQHLHLLDPVPRHPTLVNSFDASAGPTQNVLMLVLGKDGAPLPDAEVSLFGGLMPANGQTDAQGRVTLKVYGDSTHAINGVYVKPRADYWSFYQRDPDLSTDEPNVIGLRALSDWPALPGFPARNTIGWGERAMRLDQLPPGFRGQGIRVAIIDSGAATTHVNLKQIRTGFDIINKNPDTWNQDVLGHGSHCAGVIAGADPTYGIRGFVPDAEIHACKLFPGGQISQLIDALEYCMEHHVDVVNLSLGGTGPSPTLEAQILRAKRAGVACIAAAGNSGGPVQYPAASPNVLAVAAIGKLDEFPRDSYHAETINPDVDAQGYFTARFSCFGPQVDVCAPGVAIVSSVPPNNFAAWDGTSMAAPHITGLAALMLAHHPAFQGAGGMRSADRVDRLFQLIRMSARRVSLADAAHIGYGLPDAPLALGLAVAPGQQAFQSMLGTLLAGMPLQDMGRYPGNGLAYPHGDGAPYAYGLGGLRQGW